MPNYKIVCRVKNVEVPLHSVLEDINANYGSDMHRAAAIDNASEIRRLIIIDGREVDAADKKGRTPLMLACKYGQLAAAKVRGYKHESTASRKRER